MALTVFCEQYKEVRKTPAEVLKIYVKTSRNPSNVCTHHGVYYRTYYRWPRVKKLSFQGCFDNITNRTVYGLFRKCIYCVRQGVSKSPKYPERNEKKKTLIYVEKKKKTSWNRCELSWRTIKPL